MKSCKPPISSFFLLTSDSNLSIFSFCCSYKLLNSPFVVKRFGFFSMFATFNFNELFSSINLIFNCCNSWKLLLYNKFISLLLFIKLFDGDNFNKLISSFNFSFSIFRWINSLLLAWLLIFIFIWELGISFFSRNCFINSSFCSIILLFLYILLFICSIWFLLSFSYWANLAL